MSKNIFPWVKPLGLSSSDFSQKPEGADALIWGLKNNIINAEEYLAWASEYYQCPAIKPEFFSMAVDFTLIEKFINLYDWYAYCYPIYQWDDTLFIACLEPPRAPINSKVCFVIAPFHALESAWQKYENSKPGLHNATEQLPIVRAPGPASTLADTDEADQIQPPQNSDLTKTQVLQENQSQGGDPLQGLDVNLNLGDNDQTKEQPKAADSPSPSEPIIPPPPVPEAKSTEPIVPPPPVENEKADVIIPPPPVETKQEPIVPPPPVAMKQPETAAPPPAETKNPPLPPDSAGLDFADLKKEMGVDDNAPLTSENDQTENSNSEQVGVLDFSSMGEDSFAPQPTAADDSDHQTEDTEDAEDDRPADEITHTKVDGGLNNLTSATQTMHASQHTMTATREGTQTPSLPFEEVTIKGISLEGENTEVKEEAKEEKTKVSPATQEQPLQQKTAKPAPQSENVIVPPPPQPEMKPQAPPVPPKPQQPMINDDNSIPSLDDLKVHKTDNPKQAPGLEQSDINLEKENQSLNQEEFEDDYTPVPVLTKAQQQAQEKRKKEAQLKEKNQEKARLTENTITDHAQPILIPPENLVSDQEIKEAGDLSGASSMKQVMAHMFGHLKRDYEKLMWVERDKEDLYFTKYVYGDWKITELAWKMHINLTNPNIFRVAYKSGHPFHGEIHSNPHNDKYFEWWTRGKTPDFATIYPVTINETIVGFIACFGKNNEFDELGSLKKIENLYTICRKSLSAFASAKAA